VTVAALDSNSERASFSNYGDTVDVSAPGVKILSLRAAGTQMSSAVVGEEYLVGSGTSMACPHAAAFATSILVYEEDHTWIQKFPGVKSAHRPIVVDLDGDGRDEIITAFGHPYGPEKGRVHVFCGDGAPLPGWPRSAVTSSRSTVEHIGIGDLDGDGVMEVVVSGSESRSSGNHHQLYSNYVAAFDISGALLPGFPKEIAQSGTLFAGAIVLDDINGDGLLDIVARADRWNSDGEYPEELLWALNSRGEASFCAAVHLSIAAMSRTPRSRRPRFIKAGALTWSLVSNAAAIRGSPR